MANVLEQRLEIGVFLEQMSQAVERGMQAYDYVREQAVRLTADQLTEFDRRFREGIDLPEPLKRLADREKILNFTNSKLAQLCSNVDRLAAAMPPASMSQDTKRTVIMAGLGVGGTVLAGGLLYGLFRLLRGARSLVGRGVSSVGRGVRKGAKILLIAGLVTIGGAAAVIGAERASSFVTSFADRMKDDMRKAVGQKIDSAMAGANQKIDQLKDRFDQTASVASQKVDDGVATVKKTATDTVNTAQKTAVAAVTTAGGTLGAPRDTPRAKRALPDDAVSSPLESGKITNRISSEAVDFVLTRATNEAGPTVYKRMCERGWTTGDLLKHYDPATGTLRNPDASELLTLIPSTATDPAERRRYIDASRQLIVLFGKYADQLKTLNEAARAKDPSLPSWEKMLLSDMTQQLGSSLGHYKELAESLKDLKSIGNFDFRIFSQKMRQNELLRASGALLAVPVKGLSLTEELGTVSVQDLFLAAGRSGILQKTAAEYLTNSVAMQADSAERLVAEQEQLLAKAKPEDRVQCEADLADARKDLQAIRARIALRLIIDFLVKSGSDLLPLFHGVLPDREWSDKEQDNIDTVNSYLRGRQVEELLRFYQYRRMMAGGQPLEQATGLMAQQMEILGLLEKLDPGWRLPGTSVHIAALKTRQKESVIRMGADLASQQKFLTAVATTLGIPPAALAEAGALLKQPATTLAAEAGGLAIDPALSTAETYLAFLRQYPVATLSVTTGGVSVGGYIATKIPRALFDWWYSRLKPTHAAEALINAKKPWSFQLPKRAFQTLVPDAMWQNRRLAGELLDDLLEKMRTLGSGYSSRAYDRLDRWMNVGADVATMDKKLRVPAAAELATVRSEITTLSAKGTLSVDEAARLAELKQVEPALQRFTEAVERWQNPTHAKAHGALQYYSKPLRSRYLLRDIRAAGIAGNALWLGAIAAGTYATYGEYQDIDVEKQERTDLMESARKKLTTIASELQANPQFEAKDGSSEDARLFIHKQSGVTIDLKASEKQLSTLEGAMDTRVNAQRARTVTTGVGTLALGLMGPVVAMGPAGLVVAGVEITVHLGIAAHKQGRMLAFMNAAPPWLLAMFGTQESTKQGEYDWLRGASSWMLSDLFLMNSLDEVQTMELRKKLVFTIFMRDLKEHLPELLGELVGELETPEQIDAFYNGDFRSMVLPLLAVCLHTQTGVDWLDAKALDVDSGGVIVPPKVTLVQVRSAARSAALLYREHLRENNFRALSALAIQLEKDGKVDELLDVASMLDLLKDEQALGISLDALTKNNGDETSIERLLASARQRLEKSERGATVLDLTLPGGKKIALSTPGAFAALITDPVQRHRYNEVLPETTDEPSARINPGRSIEDLFTAGYWALPDAKTDRSQEYMLVFAAANRLQESIDPKLALSQGVAEDQLRKSITESAITLFASGKRNFQKEPAGWYAENGRRGFDPIAFTRIDSKIERAADLQKISALQRLVVRPYMSEKEFSDDRLVAVFCEGSMIRGFPYALSTFIYGDLDSLEKNPPQFSVVQRAVIQSTTAGGQATIQGLNRVWSGHEFLAQPAGQSLITLVKKGAHARVADFKRQQDALQAKEEAEKPQKIAQEQERAQARAAAIERSNTTTTPTYIPASSNKRAIIRCTVGDVHVSMPAPDFSPAFTAAPSGSTLAPREDQLIRITLESGDRVRSISVGITLETRTDLSVAEKKAIRTLIGSPMVLAGHSKAGDARFESDIHHEEIHRLLNLATYKSGWSWDAPRFRRELGTRLIENYDKAKDRKRFLSTLFDVLQQYPVIANAEYEQILARMEKVK